MRCAHACDPCLSRWVFIGEGIPSIALAVMLPYLLPASPTDLQKGSCLDAEELALLSADVSDGRRKDWCCGAHMIQHTCNI